ncbi:MAG: AraC family transcriptional regulator [Firmicutes bacterium]|nr:AraC family transcriptional regulator [Bacillota bacterium]
MKFVDTGRHMKQVSPPFQPNIKAGVKNYAEMVSEWNPFSQKGLALFYQFSTDSAAKSTNFNLIPDGCANILFKCDARDPRVTLTGIILKEKSFKLDPHVTYFGFKPYCLAGIKSKDLSLAELRNDRVDLEHYFPEVESLTEQILVTGDFRKRVRVLLNYAHKHLIDYDYIPGLAENLAVSMCVSKGQVQVGQLARRVGYTDRHCRGRFKRMFGITLAHYNRIMRFQNAVKMICCNNSVSLTNIAHTNGYFDQAHFIKEFKKFATYPPTKFRENLLA